jgi:hypothetical protein
MKETVQLKRTLEECLQNERQKIGELYAYYLPILDMSAVKFLRGQYFFENSRFIRFQDVPEKYLMPATNTYYFISHRWLSLENPDPNGTQFALMREYLKNLKPEVVQTWGFWYDFSCIPQRDATGIRSAKEEEQFQAALKVMHLLPHLSSNIMICDDEYLNRAWCFMEWVCATKISPVPAHEKVVIPLFNAVKYRHLALLVLFLMKDDDFRAGFMRADDSAEQQTASHLNSLVRKSLASCASTIEGDKPLITAMMYEHFWYHVRLLGFRTQVMTALLILERLDQSTVEALFTQFLIISEDPDMRWTKETTFVLESLFKGFGNPTDMIFHRNEIETKSNSSSTIE